MSAKWSLDPKEVAISGISSSSSKHGQFSRRLKVTSCTLILTHRPTGLEVQGQVPLGNYSKKEMKELRGKLYRELFVRLEGKVAKHLRVPGR